MESNHVELKKILDNHEDRIDSLEKANIGLIKDIQTLCKQLESLTGTIKWFIGIMVGGFVSFFFYAIQTGLFK